MARTVKEYVREITKTLKANGTYSKGLDMQVLSLASALRNLEMANDQIDRLEEVTVWETTRYGEKIAQHPAFKVAKDAQEQVTKQMKALGLTVEGLSGNTDDDPLTGLTEKLARRRRQPTIIKPDGGADETTRAESPIIKPE